MTSALTDLGDALVSSPHQVVTRDVIFDQTFSFT